MRVLRSQYMQLQESITLTTTTVTTNKQLSNSTIPTSSSSVTTECQKEIVQKQQTTLIESVQQTPANYGSLCNSFRIPMDAIRISAKPLQPMRRKTMTDLQTPTKPNNVNIKLLNAQGQTGIVKLVVHFYNEGPQWYTQLCRSYEGDIWKRLPRPVPTKHSKWLYECHLCSRNLCCFANMRSHLNIHLGLRPHRCADCTKKYPSRTSLLRHHKKTTHEMQSLTMGVKQSINRPSL